VLVGLGDSDLEAFDSASGLRVGRLADGFY